MDHRPLLAEVADGVATLTLNRPKALNALNARLRNTLVATLQDMDTRADVNAIIITGTGRAFCAGLDVKELQASEGNVAASIGGADIGAAITALETPIIAAINGPAVTGGFEIALSCDIVLAADSAWFQDTHVTVGLVPGWGLSQRLARVIGPYRAKEISLSARRISAEEASRLGFVSRVAPGALLLTEAASLARTIAGWSPDHVRRIKSLIDRGYTMPFGEALRFEAQEASTFNSHVTIS
jgi:enoyl-CoA hydratase